MCLRYTSLWFMWYMQFWSYETFALNVLQFYTPSTLSGTDPNPTSSMSFGSEIDVQNSEVIFILWM